MKMRETLFWAAIHNRRPQEVRCSAVSEFQAVIAVQLNSTQSVFTARCTLVQSAVLRSHVVCLSVRLSVCDVGGLWSHRLESSKIISPLVSVGCSLFATQHDGSAPRGTPLNLGLKWPTPCWFERRTHSIANCGWKVTDSATVTMESL